MVFGWFSKKKKEPEAQQKEEAQKQQQQQTPEQRKKKEAENQWLYEFLIQYLTSPVWKIPIYDFIEENCIIFDDEEENKFEYTDIHKKFKDLIEAMVQQLMIDVGINEEQFYQMCCIGLKNKNHRKIFEQILIVDNFLVFKKLMVQKNKQLELEALKEIEKTEAAQNKQQIAANPEQEKKTKLEKEKEELELAIACSLAAQEEAQKLAENEDDELQKALLQSQLSYQAEQEKQKQEQEKVLSDSKVAQAQAEQKKEVPTPVPQQQQQKQEQPKEESKEQSQEKIKAPSSLPPLKAPKSLPPLVMDSKYDRPVNDLLKQKEDLENQLKVYKDAESKIASAKVEEKPKAEGESADERKKRLLAQRELLRKKKQKQREEELKRFQELGTTNEVNNEQDKKQALQKTQSIALDLEKNMPESNISNDEKKKRLDLYSKIKADNDLI